jgi:hypothetical protein
MKIYILPVVLLFFVNCCNKKPSIIIEVDKNNYLRFKNQFDSKLVNHFPLKILSKKYDLVSNGNLDKNDIGLFLIEYDVKDDVISELEKKYKNKIKKKYSNKDDCLLKVNMFETIETKENLKIVDSTFVDLGCYNDKHPVPNFIDYSLHHKTDFWNDENFIIYVLDSKKGVIYEKFQIGKNFQMPKEWTNGYSKGFAIDKFNKTLIYWAIIW